MGKIIVVTGTMFAGKTSKLISMVNELKKNNINDYSIYRPYVNFINGKGVVLTHTNISMEALPLNNIQTLLDDKNKHIFIDSFQNLHYQFIDAIEEICVKEDKNFYLFGTRTDVYGNFQQTATRALSIADEIILLSAKCVYCGKDSVYHILKEGRKLEDDINKLGKNEEKYEPVCRECFYKKMRDI